MIISVLRLACRLRLALSSRSSRGRGLHATTRIAGARRSCDSGCAAATSSEFLNLEETLADGACSGHAGRIFRWADVSGYVRDVAFGGILTPCINDFLVVDIDRMGFDQLQEENVIVGGGPVDTADVSDLLLRQRFWAVTCGILSMLRLLLRKVPPRANVEVIEVLKCGLVLKARSVLESGSEMRR